MKIAQSKRKVSLVLGGGGARGLTQVGVIQFLQENAFEVDEVVGCSIGALVGAAMVSERMKELTEWLETLTKRDVFRLMDFANSRFGLIKGDRVLERLHEVFSDTNIEELPIRFAAIATDLKNEEEVIFRSGSLYAAIRASIAVPGIFTGVSLGDRFLVDGGVLNNVPVQHVENKDNLIIAVNLDGLPEQKDDTISKMGAIGLLQESYYVMRRKMSAMNLSVFKPDYTINVSQDSAGLWEFHRSNELIRHGYQLAKEIIDV